VRLSTAALHCGSLHSGRNALSVLVFTTVGVDLLGEDILRSVHLTHELNI